MKDQEASVRRWAQIAVVVGIAWTMAVSSALGRSGRGGRSADQHGDLNLTVRIYKFVHIPPQQISAAEIAASKIFRKAGVELTWVDCPMTGEPIQLNPSCTNLETATEIHVNIVASFAKNARADKSTMGFAIPLSPPGHGDLASISYLRAKQILISAPVPFLPLGELLGCGIAHEMGHLLLGPNHARGGLMSAEWYLDDLWRASRSQLKFSGEEAARIREDVRARMMEQESLGMAQQAAR